MYKAHLVEAIALDANISKIEARKALDALIRKSLQTLRGEEHLTLTGYGSFCVRQIDAHGTQLPHGSNGKNIASQSRRIPLRGRGRINRTRIILSHA